MMKNSVTSVSLLSKVVFGECSIRIFAKFQHCDITVKLCSKFILSKILQGMLHFAHTLHLQLDSHTSRSHNCLPNFKMPAPRKKTNKAIPTINFFSVYPCL